ncbi:hypothetical protein Taro_053819 [Colocasia esculenta]|uniref:Uncharacterized protein n=1 Tax=Colocasia esculenta TaxID=4460 RepID=A0A843XNR4_COLES|nr:hypothetical protein [Colocasia esculenta]
MLGSCGGKLGHQKVRRSAGNPTFFPNLVLLRPVHRPVLDPLKGETEEHEYTHEDGEDQE